MTRVPKILIFGGSGQDGALLAFYLKNHEIYSQAEISVTTTNSSKSNLFRLSELNLLDCLTLYTFHMGIDDPSLIIQESNPDQIYILAGSTNTASSISNISDTALVNVLGFSRILEAIKDYSPGASTFVAGSSEMYGSGPNSDVPVQLLENNRCIPSNPYGLSKLYQYQLTRQYREFFNLDITCGILFNHESEYRGRRFVTKKIVQNMVKFKTCHSHTFALGNLSSARDWSSAKDFVRAFVCTTESRSRRDHIIASGTTTTVRQFLLSTASHLDIKCHLEGTGLEERLICDQSGHIIATVSPRYFRTNDTKCLFGDPSCLLKQYNWSPKYSIDDLIYEMVNYELSALR